MNKFDDPKYEHFLVQVTEKFEEGMKKISYADGVRVWNSFAVVAVEAGKYEELVMENDFIVYGTPRYLFTIQSETPIENSNVEEVAMNPYNNLDGNGVVIGIIDTGIDYMNKEFIREDDTTKIVSIWDQTIVSTIPNSNPKAFFGTEYTAKEINMAIKTSIQGGDPYNIVPSKDNIGHGTNIASITSARGENQIVKGVLPNSSLVVVKLKENEIMRNIFKGNGITDKPVYSNADIFSALDYIFSKAKEVRKVLVTAICIGSNESSHSGRSLLEQYITESSTYRGNIIVVGTGNQGSADIHASGNIKDVGGTKTLELNISKIQNYFQFAIWVKRPNLISINIISPSGESTANIPIRVSKTQTFKFVYENTTVGVHYNATNELNGDEYIELRFNSIKQGIWKIILRGEYIDGGRFDAWLPMKEFLPEGTKFLNADPYGTFVNPSSATGAITVGYFNQGNIATISESGKGFFSNHNLKPDLVAGGVNQPVTNPGGSVTRISGSCVATAVVAGACGMILEWGILEGNNTTMYTEKVRTYLISGCIRRVGEEYPNPNWGYGRLDMEEVFNQIAGKESVNFSEFSRGSLLYRIPKGIGGNNLGPV